MNYLESTIKGIFLLILAVAGNFVAETLGCKTQQLLSNNMLSKHIVIILILYFAVDFPTGSDPNHPVMNATIALSIYVLFVLFTKMSLTFTLVVFALLTFTYVSTSFINYYEKKDPKNELIQHLHTARKGLYIGMIAVIILGFSLYFRKQRRDYSKNWSTQKFIFGVNKCKSS